MLRKEYIILVLIILLGAFFRFYDLGKTPPGLYPDEAMNGNNALETLAEVRRFDISTYRNIKVFYPENNGREGLFINLQAISIATFGNEPWALRLVSALFGTLTILGLYLLTKELFKNFQFPPTWSRVLDKVGTISNFQSNSNDPISKLKNSKFKIQNYEIAALLASFFLAVSFWHINFSRIGFRAIMVPFLSVFAIYFLLKGIRREKIWDFVWAGVFTGLGLQTYIAFRFVPFVMLIPIVSYLIQNSKFKINKSWLFVFIFLVASIIIFSPLAFYFIQHPQDFLGRGGQVSIFSAESPIKEFLKSNLLTLQMFFWKGDCNWRHNLACQSELNPIIAVLFAIGVFWIIYNIFKSEIRNPKSETNSKFKIQNSKFIGFLLLAWLIFLSLPATLTREGLPHALRSIGMIPPVMILAGLGCWWVLEKINFWLENQKKKWPTYKHQLERLNKEVILLVLVVFLAITYTTYRDYFIRWANNPNTYFAFSTDLWNLGKYLDGLPEDTYKYVVVNASGTEVRDIPMPAQTVMFATNTFASGQRERNFTYLNPYRGETSIVSTIEVSPREKIVIAFLNGSNIPLIKSFQKKFPELRVRVPGDFVVLTNN